MGDVPADIRERLAIALDVDDLVLALRFARQLRPFFFVATATIEIYTGARATLLGAAVSDGLGAGSVTVRPLIAGERVHPRNATTSVTCWKKSSWRRGDSARRLISTIASC